MLEMLARSGTARRCLWSLEGAKTETPGAFVVEGGAEGLALVLDSDSTQLQMGGRAVLELKGNGLIAPLKARSGMKDSCLPPAAEAQEIAVLDGAFEMRRDARAFVKALVELRTKVGRSKLIYTPGIAEPSNVAVLAYLGVDLFDTSLVDHRAAIGQLSLVEGAMDASKAGWVPEGTDLRALNRETMFRELALVRSMITSGRMRSSPNCAAIPRLGTLPPSASSTTSIMLTRRSISPSSAPGSIATPSSRWSGRTSSASAKWSSPASTGRSPEDTAPHPLLGQEALLHL